MGLDPSIAEARARRAYETARMRRAAVLALPLMVVAVLAVGAGTQLPIASALGALLVVAAGVFLWRGQAAGLAVLPGVVAGLIPFGLAWAARSCGHFCVGGRCTSMCLAACALGGVLGGAFLGAYAHHRNAPPGTLVYAAGLSLLTGAIGCAWLGLGGIVGLCLGLGTSMALAAVSRQRMAT